MKNKDFFKGVKLVIMIIVIVVLNINLVKGYWAGVQDANNPFRILDIIGLWNKITDVAFYFVIVPIACLIYYLIHGSLD